jgi:molecular chaperone GrpE
MVYKTLISALEEHDVKAVGEAGEAFDPNFHQAIQSVPADDDHPADTIATVLQKGYVLADRVVRPAMVSVYN